MNRKIFFTLLIMLLVCSAFAQAPAKLRVLNYVPDSCYSLQIIYPDSLAEEIELDAIERDQLLDFICQSGIYPLHNFIKSWNKKDKTTGIDFTAAIAICHNLIIIPLNNEKNFERSVAALWENEMTFKTMTTPTHIQYRYWKENCEDLSEEEMTIRSDVCPSIICTKDVALVDLGTLLPNDGLYLQPETLLEHTHFAESEICQQMLQRGMTSFQRYTPFRPLLKELFHVSPSIAHPLLGMFTSIDFLFFSRTHIGKDKITIVNESYHRDPQLSPIQLDNKKTSNTNTEELLSYAGNDPICIISYDMNENFESTVISSTIIANAFPKCPFLITAPSNYMMVIYNDLSHMIISTLEGPSTVHNQLTDFIEHNNRNIDSIWQQNKELMLSMSKEEPVAEEDATSVPEESYEGWNYWAWEQNHGLLDSIVGRKRLVYERQDDWELYTIITHNQTLGYTDEGNFDWVPTEDSSYVIVADHLCFFLEDTSHFENIRHPEVPAQLPKDKLLKSPFWMVADVLSLLNMGEPIIGNIEVWAENNSIITEINAGKELEHNLIYEVIKQIREARNKTQWDDSY